jgi:Family of unknown function (DUF5995)
MNANTIDQSIEELHSITHRAERDGRRLGYFSALYARMTAAIARGIRGGVFEDGPRMERLAVAFARLYLDAASSRLSGTGAAPAVWSVSFDACESAETCLLQHMYLGMNAHLLLDLPLAVVATANGDRLHALRGDYLRINAVVSSQLGGFHDDLCQVAPRLMRLQRRAGTIWAAGSTAVLRGARRYAWWRAEALARTPEAERAPLIQEFDRSAAWLATRIAQPGTAGRTVYKALGRGECADVRRVISALRGGQP